MKIDVISLFPEMFNALNYGITGRAIKKNLLEFSCLNPRDYTHDKHGRVDDKSYGGGPGMVMQVQPLRSAIQAAKSGANTPPKVIYLSPQGRRLDQKGCESLATEPHLVLVSGRYEGIDERLIELEIDEEWSIGDYVASGGELAAMVMIDTITRLLPGALGDEESAKQDSFVDGLLDFPHYTRPETVDQLTVPAVLTSGDHDAIATWRKQQALGRTWVRRPELLAQRNLSQEEQTLLSAFVEEYEENTV